MARDQVELMRWLGFGQFQLVSHGRGARFAHRLVLDHPSVVTRLAILDIVPTRHALRNVTRTMAAANYHWFFLAAGKGIPERMIAADPGHGPLSIWQQYAPDAATGCPPGTSAEEAPDPVSAALRDFLD
jgi:pimeloyl-ACP methyl ester carboxylesterase